MTGIPDWRADLQAENTLLEAYRVSLAIKPPPFNWWTRVIVAVLSTVGLALTLFLLGNESNIYFVELLKYVYEAMFIAAITVAAFLVTGFSVYVTMSDERLLITLASIKHKDSGLSVFKHMFYNFLKVFLVYIVAIAASSIVGFSLSITWDQRLTVPNWAVTAANAVCLWFLIQLATEMILLLKSFVWNVYGSFVSKLLAADEIRRRDEEQKRQSAEVSRVTSSEFAEPERVTH